LVYTVVPEVAAPDDEAETPEDDDPLEEEDELPEEELLDPLDDDVEVPDDEEALPLEEDEPPDELELLLFELTPLLEEPEMLLDPKTLGAPLPPPPHATRAAESNVIRSNRFSIIQLRSGDAKGTRISIFMDTERRSPAPVAAENYRSNVILSTRAPRLPPSHDRLKRYPHDMVWPGSRSHVPL